MRQVCMPLDCRFFDAASRRSSMVPKTTRVISSITLPDIWLRQRRLEVSDRQRFLLHFIAQCTMELLNLWEVPLASVDTQNRPLIDS